MFNLNIPSATLLGIDSGSLCTTPKTPEILNSLIAMTNPLDNYTFTATTNLTATTPTSVTSTSLQNGNQQMISQDSNHSSCSGSPLDSPAGSSSTPSVQQTRSQLIKAGLKLTIQSKRKMSSGDSSSGTEQRSSSKSSRKMCMESSEEEADSSGRSLSKGSNGIGLTAEDEDRRRRRRERNKIAATKCRMKKRERTNNLVSESEQLETQNTDMKTTMRNLETERRKLLEMLQSHSPTCIRPGGYQPPSNACQSPAFKYLNDIGLGDSNQCDTTTIHDQQPQQQQQRTITAIPSMNTIKYSRNNLRHQQHQQEQQQLQSLSNCNGNLPQHSQLPNGYCKPSPTQHEIGYLSSPTQDLCLQADLTSTHHLTSHHHHQQQQQHHLHHQQQQSTHHQLTTAILKTDYIPNCENSNGGSTVDSTPDFVLKNELIDAQSPYTTVQSADRFLFETNCDFDIKHCNSNNNLNNNNNNNSSTINNNSQVTTNLDLIHHQIATTPTYDNLLIKNDFLTNDSELLAQFTDGTDSEFTDLDSGITAYAHITNGGCLA